MPRLTALKMNPNSLQIHQPKVGTPRRQARSAYLGNRFPNSSTLLAKSFEHLTAGASYDAKAGLLVFDLFPKNAKLAEDGVVYPSEPVVQRIDPEFGQFLRENPDRINNR